MPNILWGDTETRSFVDLPSKGAYNYARDSSTELLLFNWAFDDGEVQEWWPDCGRPFPAQVKDHIVNGGQLRFHNAAFDRLIFEYIICPDFDVPTPKLEQWYCTAAQARANCAPGSLADVGRFASVNMKKDHRGSQLIRMLCVPPYKTDAKLFDELRQYGAQDVRAMRAVSLAMRDLSDEELLDYHVNEKINDRGVKVDIDLCEAAIRYADAEVLEIQQIVQEVTQGEIKSVRSSKMREWVLARVGDQAKKLMIVHKDDEQKFSIDKSVRANLLALAEENHDEVPPDVAEVIQCADDLWASSVAKFSRLQALADVEDARVRGAFVFAGGSATGRASSYGAQVHNFTRQCAKDPEAVRHAMVRGHQIVPTYGKRVTDVLKGMLRPALIPEPGNVFVVADWSAIEGRVHPWLANTREGEAKLDIFRSGLDPYKVNAAATFHVQYEDVTKDQRQVGKVQELALGFLGGPGAFETFGRVYGVRLTEAEVKRAVDGWRRANPWAMDHGQRLETAYTRAVRNPSIEFSAGRVTYLFDGTHLWYALPSGRVLCYPYAKLEEDGLTYAKASWKPAADAKEWPRARLWRGLACENITQATANDILRHSLRHLDGVVLHVHDEVVVECRESDADEVQRVMTDVMCTPPAWAKGLPLNIEASVMTRYGK